MLFNSLRYAYFLPVVAAAYFLAPRRFRTLLLVLASCLFYASWNARFLLLILGMTVVNYGIGLGLARLHDHRRLSGALLALGIAADLLVLARYKYALFFLGNLTAALHWTGWAISPPTFSLVLPLGISFFTFEFIHYLADVHAGHPAVQAPLRFAAFATFFPTQIAGPIKRYEDFVPQLDNPKPFDPSLAGAGLRLMVLGLFKKVALADNLAPIVQHGFRHTAAGDVVLGRGDVWLVTLAFALQIYFDFSGYTDLGRGSAMLLGFHVPENFARPYFARNISDFWRRWHISLSSWLRDYLYIPLGGNRRRRVRNLLITMILGGLWHGANWTFLVWGAWHGALLVLYWQVRPWWRARMEPVRGVGAVLAAVASWALTFALVLIGWVFFRAANLAQAAVVLRAMLGWHTSITAVLATSERAIVLSIAAGCFAVEGMREWVGRRPADQAGRAVPMMIAAIRWQQSLREVGVICLFALTLLARPGTGPRFLYFQF